MRTVTGRFFKPGNAATIASLIACAPCEPPKTRSDNLPGSREYCPLVLRNARVRRAEQYSCAQHLDDLEAEFGSDVLQRSAVWLTIKESRARSH